MKMTMKFQLACLSLAIIGAVGCFPSRKPVVKGTFLVQARRSGSPVDSDSQESLIIQPFSIAPAFQKNSVVSRTGENEYESDFYNEYFVSPAQMITDQTRNWLADSGLFAQVLSQFSSVQPTYLLEGHIRKMYMDVKEPDQPKAVLEITYFLVKQLKKDDTVQFSKTYSAETSMMDPTVQDYVDSQSAGLREILQTLETDLATIVKNTD
jgi:cholesterol transport system auxiliary component